MTDSASDAAALLAAAEAVLALFGQTWPAVEVRIPPACAHCGQVVSWAQALDRCPASQVGRRHQPWPPLDADERRTCPLPDGAAEKVRALRAAVEDARVTGG